MSRFWEDAGRLLEAAAEADAAGRTLTPMTVLISREGGVTLVAASDWPLDSLALDRGARTAYRVTPERNTIRVEGREGMQRCRLEAGRSGAIVRHLLGRPL